MLASLLAASGCGSDTTSPPATDTGISVVDSTVDSAVDTTADSVVSCDDCVKANCKTETAACDADARCKGLLACVISECKGAFSDTGCLIACAAKFGATSIDDPIVKLVTAIGTCANKNCKAECASPDAGLPPG